MDNGKVVSQPVAKRLKEAGWVKPTKERWIHINKSGACLYTSTSQGKLKTTECFAPDLLDITREIREIFYKKFDDFTNKTHFNEILWKENETDVAAEIWIKMKKGGL